LLCRVRPRPAQIRRRRIREQLRFRTEPSRIRSASLTVGDQNVHFLPWDNLNFQAVTRGGRLMDHVLATRPFSSKAPTPWADVALAGSAIAADNIYSEKRRVVTDGNGHKHVVSETEKNEGAQTTAIALGLVGIFSKIAAAATKTQADIRMWDNLPQYLSFGTLRLPPGDHPPSSSFTTPTARSWPTSPAASPSRSATLQKTRS